MNSPSSKANGLLKCIPLVIARYEACCQTAYPFDGSSASFRPASSSLIQAWVQAPCKARQKRRTDSAGFSHGADACPQPMCLPGYTIGERKYTYISLLLPVIPGKPQAGLITCILSYAQQKGLLPPAATLPFPAGVLTVPSGNTGNRYYKRRLNRSY